MGNFEKFVNKLNEERSKMTIDTQFAFPVRGYAEEENIDEEIVFDDITTNGDKYVKKFVRKEIKNNNVNVVIDKIKFSDFDSGNISHAAAYFDVKLTGSESDLRKISGVYNDIIYDWDE
jgi:hypothetical protein